MFSNHSLTEREREILQLIATGASNKEIALALHISLNTVKVHLRNIFAKIGVSSRTEAALYALNNANGQPQLPQPAAAPPLPPAGMRARKLLWWWFAALGGLLLSASLFVILARPANPPAREPERMVRWQSGPPLPQGRAEMGAAVVANQLFLIAGRDEDGLTGSVLRFDLDGGQWQAAAPKPTPVRLVQAVVLGGKIYLPGGCAADGQPGSALEVYDPRLDRWETRAEMPLALCAYALTALEGQLYLFGGWDGAQESAAVWIYDPARDAWRAGAPMPEARQAAAAAAVGDWILVAGGRLGGNPRSETWAYYPSRDRPGDSPWQPRAPLPQARADMAAASLAGLAFLAGGQPGTSLPPLEYLPASDRWVSLDASPQPAGAFPGLLPVETRLHLLGGSLDSLPSPDHQTYQAVFTILVPVVQ